MFLLVSLFKLFFFISGLFMLLVVALVMSLLWKVRLGFRRPFPGAQEPPRRNHFSDDGKVIEGEYTVIEDTKKD